MKLKLHFPGASLLLMSLTLSVGCNHEVGLPPAAAEPSGSSVEAGASDASASDASASSAGASVADASVADASSVAATATKEVSGGLVFDPDNFDDPTNIDNEWYPMKPGMQLVWEGVTVDPEGESENHRVVFTVTDLTKVIGGVRTVVCWDQDLVDGKDLVESEIVFFAQDNDGAIWSLGEYPEEYEDDVFLAAPCWIHGIQESTAGILIPANTDVGTPSFSQGWAPSVGFTDRGKIDQKGGQEMTVPFGTYDDVLVIDEWNAQEPDAHALKYYARNIGHIAIRSRGTGDKEILDLTEMRELSPQELREVRNAAMQLESNAYQRSKDMYALTQPSEYSGSDPITVTPLQLEESDQEAAPSPKITDDEAKQIALKEVPGDVTAIAAENKLGKRAIVVEVLTADGTEVDVIIDPQTGEVLATEQ